MSSKGSVRISLGGLSTVYLLHEGLLQGKISTTVSLSSPRMMKEKQSLLFLSRNVEAN